MSLSFNNFTDQILNLYLSYCTGLHNCNHMYLLMKRKMLLFIFVKRIKLFQGENEEKK